MGGQVLGGGVIVAVAVLLWLVYLLPTWQSRHRYNASERNAVRLNQALRILAETSETPEEVRVELTARTALAQQKLARRAQAERESADLEVARRDLAAARSLPDARRARARRRARLVTTIAGVIALALTGLGLWQTVTAGSQLLLWAGVGASAVCVMMLTRMAAVSARASVAPAVAIEEAVEERVVADMQDVELVDERLWTPRELPRPLAATAGSQASAALDAAAARVALRQAAREEAMRERAAARRPPSIDTARAARAASLSAASNSDAEIEAHVRELLRNRAAG